MALSRVAADAFLQVIQRTRLGRAREERAVDVVRGVPPDTTDDDVRSLGVPLDR
jgi:hypothetical protein